MKRIDIAFAVIVPPAIATALAGFVTLVYILTQILGEHTVMCIGGTVIVLCLWAACSVACYKITNR